ncbi:acyltransferase [Sphingomonas sp. KR1UV-12]|uniref:Acyltransferase n=1 Tax=Sphingomonas aurea TaxID=3063994 RepID=A0ABT9EFZ1_9SPHN|nr:acyltransferase [Sphingomonas sp. KR1UV-12]MDP1025804.1 acyltransferase [Sphingomonas sp. KR1UV-12]
MPDTLSAATSTSAVAPGKRHYAILDGLRGVAAVMVVIFHLFEAYAGGDSHRQIVNHGYLAVDFFFLLSGFVIAYAYDDRWGGMTLREFFTRRLIRLQPMIVLGSLIGAVLFYTQAGRYFPLIAATPVWQMLLVMLLGMTLLPLPPSLDIRGWDEMHPLNGPAWSLFFEYVANIAYALGMRRLSNRVVALLLVPAAALLADVAVFGPRGDLVGGWALDAGGLKIGFARLTFPFLAGMLLMRTGWRLPLRHGFAICAVLLAAALALPRVGGVGQDWMNGLYEVGCVVLLFPLIVAIGAGQLEAEGRSVRIARVFGDLSYPLYITHYPLVYLYTAWVVDNGIPQETGAIVGAATLAAALAIAWASLRFYDAPIRRRLAQRFLRARNHA